MIILKFIKYRLPELPVWLGTSFLGVFFTGVRPDLIQFVLFVAATAMLMLHTLLFNDWAGQKINPAERDRVVLRADEKAELKSLALASFALLFISVMLYTYVAPRLLVPVCCIVFLSLLYSHPAVHLKESSAGSFIIHLVGGELKFLLGFLLLSNDIPKGLMTGMFFALIFTAGSLVHQCLHEPEDREAGIVTAAVRYGKIKVMGWGVALFALSHVHLFFLSVTGLLNWNVNLIFFPGLTTHLFGCFKLLKGRVEKKDIIKYRRLYRAAYGLASALLAAFLLLNIIKI